MTIDQIEAAVLALSANDRARLAQQLIASLEGGTALEEAWYDVAEKRLAQLESGEAQEMPAAKVFAALGLEVEK